MGGREAAEEEEEGEEVVVVDVVEEDGACLSLGLDVLTRISAPSP